MNPHIQSMPSGYSIHIEFINPHKVSGFTHQQLPLSGIPLIILINPIHHFTLYLSHQEETPIGFFYFSTAERCKECVVDKREGPAFFDLDSKKAFDI